MSVSVLYNPPVHPLNKTTTSLPKTSGVLQPEKDAVQFSGQSLFDDPNHIQCTFKIIEDRMTALEEENPGLVIRTHNSHTSLQILTAKGLIGRIRAQFDAKYREAHTQYFERFYVSLRVSGMEPDQVKELSAEKLSDLRNVSVYEVRTGGGMMELGGIDTLRQELSEQGIIRALKE